MYIYFQEDKRKKNETEAVFEEINAQISIQIKDINPQT